MKPAIIILALLCAGCGKEGAMIVTDEKGCKWTVPVYDRNSEIMHPTRDFTKLTDATGKQICEVKP